MIHPKIEPRFRIHNFNLTLNSGLGVFGFTLSILDPRCDWLAPTSDWSSVSSNQRQTGIGHNDITLKSDFE